MDDSARGFMTQEMDPSHWPWCGCRDFSENGSEGLIAGYEGVAVREIGSVLIVDGVPMGHSAPQLYGVKRPPEPASQDLFWSHLLQPQLGEPGEISGKLAQVDVGPDPVCEGVFRPTQDPASL